MLWYSAFKASGLTCLFVNNLAYFTVNCVIVYQVTLLEYFSDPLEVTHLNCITTVENKLISIRDHGHLWRLLKHLLGNVPPSPRHEKKEWSPGTGMKPSKAELGKTLVEAWPVLLAWPEENYVSSDCFCLFFLLLLFSLHSYSKALWRSPS